MKVLIVKLTSLGDVIHVLPAISDAKKTIPKLEIDFLVDEMFAEIPSWHQGVNVVKTVANRRWRRSLFKSFGDIRTKYRDIKNCHYDKVIDLQGLMKSAVWAKVANGYGKGELHGYDKTSIKEPLAAMLYSRKHSVKKDIHAIDRNRRLLAKSLAYEFDESNLDYGISSTALSGTMIELPKTPYWVFLHGTAWASKQWPEKNWESLIKKVNDSGRSVILPWGNQEERARAERLSRATKAIVLPKSTLTTLVSYFNAAEGVVSVDTGLGHLAAALDRPTLAIYGPTDTRLIGIKGNNIAHLSVDNAIFSEAQKVAGVATIKTNKRYDYSRVTPKEAFNSMKGISKIK